MKLEFDVPKGYEALFKEVVNEMIKKITTWPKIGDKYYYISDWMDVEEEEFDDDEYDSRLQSIDNMFKTKEEAEFKLEQLKVLHELKKLVDDDQEWDGDHRHFVIKYKHDVNKLSIEYWITDQHCQFYFKSMQSAQAAINKIGEERLKKYYFCVPENK